MSGKANRREAGYTLIALIATLAISMILMAAGVPSWRYLKKNSDEEELIFRGKQIAEAIQRYQKKNGNALPPSLEVMVKGKFLRKAFKDPMTKEGKWRYLRPGEGIGAAPPMGIPGAPSPPTTTRPAGRPRFDDGGDPRPHPGSREHERREEPSGRERAHEVQRVDLPARPGPGRGSAAGTRPAARGHAFRIAASLADAASADRNALAPRIKPPVGLRRGPGAAALFPAESREGIPAQPARTGPAAKAEKPERTAG